jgi:hypothetical protein
MPEHVNQRRSRATGTRGDHVMTKLRVLAASTAILAVLIGSTSPTLAQGTAEQRAACTGDAFRLCAGEIPNVARITSCMKVNFSRLSPGCKAVFVKG